MDVGKEGGGLGGVVGNQTSLLIASHDNKSKTIYIY